MTEFADLTEDDKADLKAEFSVAYRRCPNATLRTINAVATRAWVSSQKYVVEQHVVNQASAYIGKLPTPTVGI
jgi:hypothetical protein